MCPFTDAPNHAVWVGLSDGRLLWINVESGALQDQAFVHPQAVRYPLALAGRPAHCRPRQLTSSVGPAFVARSCVSARPQPRG